MRLMRTLGLSLALVMLAVVSAQAVIRVKINDASGNPGSRITVQVAALDTVVAADSVFAYQFTMTYDPAVLTPIPNPTGGIQAQSVGTLGSGFSLPTANATSPGTLIVAAAGITPATGKGPFVEIPFTVSPTLADTVVTSLSFTTFRFNEGTPAATPTNGTFSVPVRVGGITNIQGIAGVPLAVPIVVNNLTGLNVLSYSFVLQYNALRATAVGTAKPGTLSEAATDTFNLLSPGRVRVAAAKSSPFAGSGPLVGVRFDVANPGPLNLRFESFTLNEGSPGAVIDTIPPVITSVNFSATGGPVKGIGDTIQVVLTGTSNMAASFALVGLVQNVPMAETSAGSGTYTGRYVIARGDEAPKAAVRGQLRDPSGNIAFRVAADLFAVDAKPPVFVRRPALVGATSTSAIIEFSTDEPHRAALHYGTSPSLGTTITDTVLARDRRVTLTGLTANTAYLFRAFVKDAVDNRDSSAVASFATLAGSDVVAPVIVSGPGAIGITDSAATIVFETDELSTGRVGIGLTAGTVDTVNTTNESSPSRLHRITLTGLVPDMTYYFRVGATDISGNAAKFFPSASTPRAFRTRRVADTIPPRLVEFPAVVGLTQTSALIVATTDEIAFGYVQYVALDSTLTTTEVQGAAFPVTRHRIPLTGLSSNTQYFFRVRFVDPSNNQRITPFQSFTTPAFADTIPPGIVRGPAVLAATAARATIVYETDEPSDTEILYNAVGSADTTRRLDTEFVTNHQFVLTNLLGGITYEYRVQSRDQAGNRSESRRRTFTTTAVDSLPPVFVEGPIIGYNGGSVVVVLVTTDEPATIRVDAAPANDLTNITTVFGDANVVNHRIALTNLNLGAPYRFLVTATDASGNSRTFPPSGLTLKQISALAESRALFRVLQVPGSTGRFTTNPQPDTQAPVLLSGPTIIAQTSAALTISWVTDELCNSIIEYGTTAAFGQVTTVPDNVTAHTVTITNLAAGTIYSYRISSTDPTGNGPTQGPLPTLIASATTATEADVTPPVISGVTVSSVTNDRAVITWTTDELSDSFVDFGTSSTSLNQTLGTTALSTSHSVTLTNLTAGIGYSFRVKSTDVSGNGPRLSSTSSFTTTSTADATPPAISGIVIQPGYRSASLSWTTDEPSNSFVHVITGANDTLTVASATNVTTHALTVTDTTFLQAGAISYSVLVGSTDPTGNTATSSSQPLTTLATQDVTPPAAPANLTAIAGNGAVRLRWSRNTETDLAGYEVFRTVSGVTAQVQSGITDTTYLDNAVTNGTVYTYSIKAVDHALPTPNTSTASSTVSATPATANAPSAPGPASPADNAEVSRKPILVISDATPGTSGGTLAYTFAVYTDSLLTQLVTSTSGIPQGTSTNPTHWQVIDQAVSDSVALQDGVRYWWRARANDGTFDGAWSSAQSLTAKASKPVSVDATAGSRVPGAFALAQNYPNPFNPTTRIRYALPRPGSVTIIVYNLLGQAVRMLLNDQPHQAGFYAIEWNGRNETGRQVGTGVYFYRIVVRDAVTGREVFTRVRKMVLVK
ncbi:MAG: T9SS type A sorting domain-containing protein [Candidatus Latescibacteria bacterium]|nr:T9SS type A sorting domain-containing protein [Candidatus Latescibacterota bacterium]